MSDVGRKLRPSEGISYGLLNPLHTYFERDLHCFWKNNVKALRFAEGYLGLGICTVFSSQALREFCGMKYML